MEDRTCLVAIANTAIETTTDSDDMDPLIYKEAMQSPERNQWQEAIREELESLFFNNTFILPDNSEIEVLWIQHQQWKILRTTNSEMKHSEASLRSIIRCDNMGALRLIQTGIVTAKTRHIDIKY
jgi:hypothetical protein